MNNVCFIGATHGDEVIGVNALQKVSNTRSDVDWIIGNQAAFDQGVRYVEADLNRSGPGDLNSAVWEERRAAELIELSQQYQYMIDIHGSKQDNGVFLIVTNPKEENLKLASLFDIDRVVIWPSLTPEMQYPPSEFFRCGLEIECGEQNDPAVQHELERVINDFLDTYKEREEDWQTRLAEKELYRMTGFIPKNEETLALDLKEFEAVQIDGKEVVPIFVGSYGYKNVLGYALERVNIDDL